MKKTLSALLALLMIICAFPVCYATDYNSTISQDATITIKSSDNIGQGAVFNCPVTISAGAKVSCGVFNGDVTVEKGTFLFGTISGGTFNGKVTNNGYITNENIPELKGEVINNGSISGGKFNCNVTNNNSGLLGISGGEFNKTVTNNGTINSGSFYSDVVNNSGSNVNGGIFYKYITNSGNIANTVSAVIKSGDNYTVKGLPTIKTSFTIDKNSSLTVPSGTILTIDADAELTLNGALTIEGQILVNGKLKAVTGTLTSGTGKIYVPTEGSFTGINTSKFDSVTYKEYSITIGSNLDKNQYDFILTDYTYYKGDTVNFSFGLEAATGCITINSVTVYEGNRANNDKIILKTSNSSGSFTMPDSNVYIYIDLVANHTETSSHKDPYCETTGYDKVTCSVCYQTISETTIPALGHAWSEWSYNNSESGYLKSRHCSRCSSDQYTYIETVNYVSERTEKYKTSVTFKANVKASGSYSVKWYKRAPGGSWSECASGLTARVEKATEDYEIKAVVLGLSVSGISETEVETVKIKHGFFDRIGAFFRELFGIKVEVEQ